MFRPIPISFAFLIGTTFTGLVMAQPKDTNYDESKVPQYELPDALLTASGERVRNADTWNNVRRPELLQLFATHMFGSIPRHPVAIESEVTSETDQAIGGKAIRREVTIYLLGDRRGPKMRLLLFLPKSKTPAPVFVGLNFNGNHAVHADPGIALSTAWMRDGSAGVVDHRATEASRGSEAARWQVEKVIERGYGLATIYYGDIEPDHVDGWKTSLRAAMQPDGANAKFERSSFGAIGAWAFGLSRAMDYFSHDPSVNSKQVAVLGHSRLGKTALWAGAIDPRFAIVISNNSGEGGAAITRRRYGERIVNLVTAFPHWFCPGFRDFAERENELPFDAHELIALSAPRPVYIASATEDQWADPKGEFEAAREAGSVYALFGLKGVEATEMPAPDHPVGDYVGFHLRTGIHDVTAFDWDQFLNFADRHFGRR